MEDKNETCWENLDGESEDPYQEIEEKYQDSRTYCPNGEKHELEEIGTAETGEKMYRCSKCGWEDAY